MDKKIFLKDLYCYKNATEVIKKHKLFCPDRCFDLSKMPETEILEEMKKFICERCMELTPLSIRADLYPFNLLNKFLCSVYPQIQSFLDITEDEMIKKAKVWLLKNGKNLTQTRKRTETENIQVEDAELIKYIHKIYRYLKKEIHFFDYESDRWYLAMIPIEIQRNPVKNVKSISFEKIKQLEIKNQVKCVIYMHLSTVALGTVLAEMTAINRFSQFLNERYIDIDSLEEVDRKVCEDYLVYINTEAIGRKSYSKDLSHLRSIFVTAGKVLENEKLENLFFRDDLGKVPAKLYKVYSHAELKRLNAAIVEGDEQIARALILHQLLGTRISETLSLEQDAIREGREGRFFIRIKQIKTRKTFEKPINEDIRQLFEKSCEYTQAKYGNRKYVFVNDTNPDQAMQYSRIQYQLMVMIQKQNLRDDSGELIGVGTHIWRHCYGKRLTEMHVDDVTIAKLLGHANTSNLKHYRKVGDALLANETRQMRNFMDEILTDVIHEWEGDRNIIK